MFHVDAIFITGQPFLKFCWWELKTGFALDVILHKYIPQPL